MAKLNISIPDELRERMTGLNVNWSHVAQQAFAHVAEVEELLEAGKDLEAGLARLRADKHRHGEREQAEGFQDGTRWALTEASYDELKDVVTRLCGPAPAELAVQWVNEHRDRTGFAIPGADSPRVSAAYAQGFVQGASAVLAQV